MEILSPNKFFSYSSTLLLRHLFFDELFSNAVCPCVIAVCAELNVSEDETEVVLVTKLLVRRKMNIFCFHVAQ